MGKQKVTEILDDPPCCKGGINLSGTMIPVIDFRLYLGKPEEACSSQVCFRT